MYQMYCDNKSWCGYWWVDAKRAVSACGACSFWLVRCASRSFVAGRERSISGDNIPDIVRVSIVIGAVLAVAVCAACARGGVVFSAVRVVRCASCVPVGLLIASIACRLRRCINCTVL